MNASLLTADRSTHLKIAVLAVLSCTVFIAIGMSGRNNMSDARLAVSPARTRADVADLRQVTAVGQGQLSTRLY